MHLARHGTRPPPRPGTRGLSPCLPGRSAREGLDYRRWHERAAIPQQHARRPNRRPSTPNPVPPRSGKRRVAVYALAAIPHADVERLSKFLRAPPVHMPARPRASRRSAGAKKSTPCFGRWLDQSVRVPQTRSPADAPKRFDLLNPGTLPPRKEHADTSESPFRLGTSNRIRTGVAGLPRWPPTRRCAACGVANGPTTLVSHVSLRRVSLRERVLPGTGVAGRLTRPSGGDGQHPV